jgi:hypothetical protein
MLDEAFTLAHDRGGKEARALGETLKIFVLFIDGDMSKYR